MLIIIMVLSHVTSFYTHTHKKTWDIYIIESELIIITLVSTICPENMNEWIFQVVENLLCI